MRVSHLRLPDPLEERGLDLDAFRSEVEGALAQLGDGQSERDASDVDGMSLPSSTGLSQLSVVTDGRSAAGDSSAERLEMSVASTRASLAGSSFPLQKQTDGDRSILSDLHSGIGGGYSIISLTHGGHSPTYSITSGRTSPPPPARSSTLHDAQVKAEESHTASPRNLKEYVDSLSVADQQGDKSEHQKNFELWLKSVTPYSQRTCCGEAMSSISPMSSLASPIAKLPASFSRPHAGLEYNPKANGQSSFERNPLQRYAHLRQEPILPTFGCTAEDNSSHGLHSLLTLHSSDVSVRMPAVTDSPGSVKARRNQATEWHSQAAPISDSYTAALETIEKLCETVGATESVANNEPLSSSANQSFKTALTSLETASSARLAITREYDAGDEHASFGSPSSDSGWETEKSSDSEGTDRSTKTKTKTKRKPTTRSRQRTGLLCMALSLLSKRNPQSSPKRPSATGWFRYCFWSLIMLTMSIVIGKYYVPAPVPAPDRPHVANKVADAIKLHDPQFAAAATATRQTVQGIETASSGFQPASAPSVEKPRTATQSSNRYDAARAESRQSYVFESSRPAGLLIKIHLVKYLFILAVLVGTAYFLRSKLVKARWALRSESPSSGGLRYVLGRKIVIRPSLKQDKSPVDSQKVERPEGSSIDCPIILEDDDMASLSSSTVTVVPTQRKGTTAASRVLRTEHEVERSESTPISIPRKGAATPRKDRCATVSPPGSDRLLRSQTKPQNANAEPSARSPTSAVTKPVFRNTGKQKEAAPAPADKGKGRATRSAVRAETSPATSTPAGTGDRGEALARAYNKAASVPARDRKQESFHVCFLHGSPGVGKASLLQRAKNGTYFDPEHPVFPGPESLEEFKNFRDIMHLHFAKREILTTLVFGYGRMLDNPDSRESRVWKETNKVYTSPDVQKSKFNKRGNNVHVILYTANDKREAVRIAARTLAKEPEAQIAMVLAKSDLIRSEQICEAAQAHVHAAMVQALGPEHSMARITHYRTSARTRAGVDELFSHIARKFRREAIAAMQASTTLPMDLD